MTGLTNEQVQERIAEGKVNANENPNTRTYKQIIRENTLTFFNFLNLVLLVLVLFVRSYKNSMFMGIILINTVIGIIQEVRAKKTIDKLAILVGMENALKTRKLTKELLLEAKRMEFPDYIIARLTGKTEEEIKALREEYQIKAAYKMVDTCAAEVAAATPQ